MLTTKNENWASNPPYLENSARDDVISYYSHIGSCMSDTFTWRGNWPILRDNLNIGWDRIRNVKTVFLTKPVVVLWTPVFYRLSEWVMHHMAVTVSSQKAEVSVKWLLVVYSLTVTRRAAVKHYTEVSDWHWCAPVRSADASTCWSAYFF